MLFLLFALLQIDPPSDFNPVPDSAPSILDQHGLLIVVLIAVVFLGSALLFAIKQRKA